MSELTSDTGPGKDKTFKIFFESFYPSLYLVAKKYIQEDEAALDIVQDAFVYFWEKRKEIPSANAAKSYLYKTVKNKCLNYLRDKKQNERIKSEDLESEIYFRDAIIEEETYQIIHNVIKTLPAQTQRIIELSLDGLKNQEIADLLSISVNTVKTLKLRAFKSLREKLKDHFLTLLVLHQSFCQNDSHIESKSPNRKKIFHHAIKRIKKVRFFVTHFSFLCAL